MLDTDYLDAGQKILRRIILSATNDIETAITRTKAQMIAKFQDLNETLNTQYENLLEAINQQSILLYIILGLLGLVTVLIIVSILNQRKLKKELREMRELLESRNEPEDKPQ